MMIVFAIDKGGLYRKYQCGLASEKESYAQDLGT